MSMKRRDFLKIAGISSILSVGAKIAEATHPAWVTGPDPKQLVPNKQALSAKRWAMIVDMTKFKTEADTLKVIDACHRAHNVPDFRTPDGKVDKKLEVKWIWQAGFERAFPGQDNKYMSEHLKDMPFMVLCNHCDNPPCVRVCPTQATYKLKNGITMQDMHRCIGCRFCMAGCPYGARSFNWVDPRKAANLDVKRGGKLNNEYPQRTKGVVEKCTFCTERLQIGKMPACVEAAPKGALLFGDLEDQNSEIRKIITTRYTIRRKPDLGTGPAIYYLIGGSDHA
ncbi:MAG: 4Fe-4S ferredoxin [Nitrospirae bacterium GWC2_57_13]|jgi:Fe-S-cluster-containing dehydrogenase component|nr:MAG: 4Fe-4S ferredoxin [Nitrospirae bacterium GWC2_57_13]HAS54442.1 4Fe-4S ferredoxin [Nitrospiraceae bacterium]